MAEMERDSVSRLRTVIGQLSRRLRSTAAGANLTPTQTSVLFTVVRSGPLGLSELAQREGLNATMLSRVIAGLAEEDLLTRLVDPSDRRAASVQATTAGQRLRERIHKERNEVLSAHLRALPADHRRSLLAALPALERLAAELSPPAP